MRTYKPFEQLSIQYRGAVLHGLTYMEAILNYYIATFFCGSADPDKKDAMQLLILGDDRMSFKAKVDVFVWIAQNHDLDWYNSYKSKKKELKHDLIYIMEQRNIFAHRLADDNTFSNFLKEDIIPGDTLRLISFKNSTQKTDYSKEKFEELIEMIENITYFILPKV